MDMDIGAIEIIIDNINADFPLGVYEDGIHLELHSDGFYIVVTFCSIQLWSEDDDDREFREDTNEYEPLEPFLRRKVMELIDKIKGIKV